LPGYVLQVRQLVVGIVAVFVPYLVSRKALAEEGIGDQAV
jgi:hypothetical protein